MNTPELIAFIIGIIISVGISALAIYAVLIIKKLSKYDNDVPKQIEFCKTNRTCFIALEIVSVFSFIVITICYAFLITSRDDYTPIFLMCFMFVSLLPIITFFTTCFTAKYRKYANKPNIAERMNAWFMIAFTMIGVGIVFMIVGMPLMFCVEGIVGKIGQFTAIIGVISLMCSLLFTFIACLKARKRTAVQPNISNVEEPNLGVDKEIIVEDTDTEDDEQARRNEEAREANVRQMREMQERIARERAEEDEKERIRQEKRKQSITNLNANKEKLIIKYSNVVENFILKIAQKYNNVFLGLFNDTDNPLSSTLVNPYKNQHNLFCDTVKRDGLDFVQSSDDAGNEYLQNIIRTLIQGLKKRINENSEWEDEYTLPVLLYYIVRNNVIKYYHSLYLKEIGCLTIEEFCEKHSNSEIPKANALAYTYYYIYENDINLPFMDTYKKLCADMLKTIAEQKQRKLESDLFGTPKTKPIFTNKTVSETLSPIEKVDRMSGEEFEIFMEDYFIKNGYKVERTPLSGDYGVDLIIEHTFGKTGVQLKCYSKKVPSEAVAQVKLGLQHYGLSNGMVITNNYFQPSAIALAADNNITLWDRDKLIKIL